jgi:thiosulfate:glutathione sulfurtransferase
MLLAPSIIAARFESNRSGAGSTVKERQKYLQADWVTPKLSYEEVKRRTQEPTEVRLHSTLKSTHIASTYIQDAYLIDVREPEEIAQGSIPSSVPLPLSTLSSSLHLRGDEFLNKHGFIKPAYNQEIVFYCRSGRRSATASDVARRNGYTKYAPSILFPISG